MFESLFKNGVNPEQVLICLLSALISGFIFALLCYVKSKSSKSFFITALMLPLVVALVIILVNGSIGTGIAIAGAFSLVRFRSAQGTAKEICVIFISMASGLAFGMGYVGYGVLFLVACGLILLLLGNTKLFERKIDSNEKIIRITIPEELDYTCIFSDLFNKYTEQFEIIKVKTINMGSMFRIYYKIIIKTNINEKEMIDEIRCRNGNLEVSMQRIDFELSDL